MELFGGFSFEIFVTVLFCGLCSILQPLMLQLLNPRQRLGKGSTKGENNSAESSDFPQHSAEVALSEESSETSRQLVTAGPSDACSGPDSRQECSTSHPGGAEKEGAPGLPSDDEVVQGGRNRCPALKAQQAGQGPELPQGCSAVVVRNIPRAYTPDMLTELLRERSQGQEFPIDFLYVPFDPAASGRNVGFAIANFRTPEALTRFAAEFHLASARDVFPGCRSRKLCEITPAPLQGKDRNVQKLASCPMWPGQSEWLARLFDGQGCVRLIQP